MTVHSEIPGPNDPGLTALVMLLRFHGVGADPAQIRHQCGTATIGTAEMIRCAREFGLKARELKTNWDAPGENPFAGHCGAQGRRLSPARQGRRRQGRRAVDEDAAPGIDDQGRPRGDLGRPPRSDDPARQPGWTLRAVSTSPGFWARFTNIGTNWARCWSRRSSYSCLRSLRRCSFRWSSTRSWSIAASVRSMCW